MKFGEKLLALLLAASLLFTSALAATDSVTAPSDDPKVVASPEASETPEPAPTPSITPAPKTGKMCAVVSNEDGTAVYKTMDETGEAVKTLAYAEQIEVSQLGLGWCMYKDGGEKRYVRTRDLVFGSAPMDSQIAIVHLKNSSKLPLHKEASSKSKTLKKIANGTYVAVLEKGQEYSRVIAAGKEGYLQNKYLSFRTLWQDDVYQAKLQDPDKPTRKTTVNLRSANTSNGKKIKALKTGLTVTVLNVNGEWAEIELDGIHGYVMSKYIHAAEDDAQGS